MGSDIKRIGNRVRVSVLGLDLARRGAGAYYLKYLDSYKYFEVLSDTPTIKFIQISYAKHSHKQSDA